MVISVMFAWLALNGLRHLLCDCLLLIAKIISCDLHRRSRDGVQCDRPGIIAGNFNGVRNPANLTSDRVADVSNEGLRDSTGRTYSSCRVGMRILTVIQREPSINQRRHVEVNSNGIRLSGTLSGSRAARRLGGHVAENTVAAMATA